MVALWPLPAKIAELGEIAAARHPQLAPRIERAVAIAIGRDWAYWGDDLWDIRGYLVTTHSCTCPDVENSAPVFHGRRICKHQLTVILLNRAYADLETDVPISLYIHPQTH